MNTAWQEHQHRDPHCSNVAVDRIFHHIRDLSVGHKLAGAGGGGFMGILAKDGEAAIRLKQKLSADIPDVDIYDWKLI